MHTVESTSKETGFVRDAVSMATKTTCLARMADWLTGTPLPGAPDMYGHMLPLQIISLIKRDRSFRSAARASIYSSRQALDIGPELTLTPSSMGYVITSGFAAEGYCATAEPETPSLAHTALMRELHRNKIKHVSQKALHFWTSDLFIASFD